MHFIDSRSSYNSLCHITRRCFTLIRILFFTYSVILSYIIKCKVQKCFACVTFVTRYIVDGLTQHPCSIPFFRRSNSCPINFDMLTILRILGNYANCLDSHNTNNFTVVLKRKSVFLCIGGFDSNSISNLHTLYIFYKLIIPAVLPTTFGNVKIRKISPVTILIMSCCSNIPCICNRLFFLSLLDCNDFLSIEANSIFVCFDTIIRTQSFVKLGCIRFVDTRSANYFRCFVPFISYYFAVFYSKNMYR